MKKVLYFGLAALMAVSCTKKPTVSPEPEPAETEETEVVVVSEESNTGVTTDAMLVEGELDNEAVEQVAAVIETTEPGSQVAINPKYDYDQILTDSVWVDYMIKPGDYLSLIAYNEYGNANEWRRIYRWNREMIGDDPDKIYPYNELDLKKPQGSAVEFSYEHYLHTVQSGETLWIIANKEYGDSYAWVVLFWDNEKLINDNDGNLYPGMKLKVRTSLWPGKE